MRPHTPTAVATVALVFVLARPVLRAGTDESAHPSKVAASKPVDASGATAASEALDLRRLETQFVYDQADAQKKALDFIGAPKAHAEAVGSLQQCKGCHRDAQYSVRSF